MNFNFSKEELLLKNSVREYIRDRIIPMADAGDQEGPLSKKNLRECFAKLAPFGYIGPLAPAAHQGPGLSHVETGIIFLELARGWAALGAAALATSSMISLMMNANSTVPIRKMLPGLLLGNIIGAVAATEPMAGIDKGAIAAHADLSNDHYLLNGEKTWVSNGAVADAILITVNVDIPPENETPWRYMLVEKETSPFFIEEIPKMGLKGLSTARLVFDQCRVPKENLLVLSRNEMQPASYLRDVDACIIAAMAIGLGEAALDKSVSYARQRVQFGKALGQFQMIQTLLAEMATNLDASVLLCFRALKRLDEGVAASKEAAMAKSFATRTAVDAASNAIQIHGAYGYSDEFPMERYYRDACCLGLMGGHSDIAHLQIAQAVTGLCALA